MEDSKLTPYEEKPHTCTKTALACKYLPHIQPASARRTLNEWIETHDELKAELAKTNYRKRAILLTPAQVGVIYNYLGKP